MEKNVNMVTHVNVFIKESGKHMEDTSNADLDAGVILAIMWKEDVREKKNLDGAFLEKSFMDTFYRMTQNTPDKSEVVKWKLKIDKGIKEENMYIIMITTEIHLG